MPILNMKDYQEYKKEHLKIGVEILKNIGIVPTLKIITDGEDKRTETYMKSKLKLAKELGLVAEKIVVNSIEELDEAMSKDSRCICQLPIKKELENYYMANIKQAIDVDGFADYDNVFNDSYHIIPATPKGIMEHIEFLDYNLRGKNVVILGRGNLVGKPLSILMMNKGATVSVLNSKTDEQLRKTLLLTADIVVCATGVIGSVKASELSNDKQVLVYNVGTCFKDGKLTTELEVDIDKENIYYTDRIGAVGVCTVLGLMDNVINSYLF